MRVGECRDFQRLAQAAGPDDVGHHDVRGVGVEDAAVGVAGEEPLARGLRHAGFLHEAGKVGCAVGLEKILHPHHVIGLERAGDAERAIHVPARMPLERDLHLVADRLPDFLHGPQALRELVGEQVVADGADGGPAGGAGDGGDLHLRREAVPRPDLHRGDALREQRAGEFAGVFQEAGLVGIERSIHAGVVDADGVTRLAAEQVEDGLAGVLAEQIPERDVEGGDGAHLGAGMAEEIRVGKQRLPVPLAVERRLPEQERRGEVVDDGLDGGGDVERLTEAHEPVVRVQVHPEQVGEIRGADRLDAGEVHFLRRVGADFLGASVPRRFSQPSA